jgi:superfamily II DNA/RNA helicase
MTLRHEDLTVEGIKQIYLDCNSDADKYDVLVKFYGLLTIGSSIIFVKVRILPSLTVQHFNSLHSIDPRNRAGDRAEDDR